MVEIKYLDGLDVLALDLGHVGVVGEQREPRKGLNECVSFQLGAEIIEQQSIGRLGCIIEVIKAPVKLGPVMMREGQTSSLVQTSQVTKLVDILRFLGRV